MSEQLAYEPASRSVVYCVGRCVVKQSLVTATKQRVWTGARGAVTAVTVHPRRNNLCAAADESGVRLLELDRFDEDGERPVAVLFEGLFGRVRALAFTAEGAHLVAIGESPAREPLVAAVLLRTMAVVGECVAQTPRGGQLLALVLEAASQHRHGID